MASYKLALWMQKCKIMCSCRQGIVCYCCQEASCPYNVADPLYCRECLTLMKHEHYPHKMIQDILGTFEHQWTIQRIQYKQLLNDAQVRYQELQPLIMYFEAEMDKQGGRGPQISQELALLGAECAAFDQKAIDFDRFVAHCDLNSVFNLQPFFEAHAEKLHGFESLRKYPRPRSTSGTFQPSWPATRPPFKGSLSPIGTPT